MTGSVEIFYFLGARSTLGIGLFARGLLEPIPIAPTSVSLFFTALLLMAALLFAALLLMAALLFASSISVKTRVGG